MTMQFLHSDLLTRSLSKCVFGPRAVYAGIRTGFPDDVDFQKSFKTRSQNYLKNAIKELPKISKYFRTCPKISEDF